MADAIDVARSGRPPRHTTSTRIMKGAPAMHLATIARRLQSVVLAGVLVAAAATVASAAIPSANGTLSACFDKVSGQLRLTDPADNAPKGCSNKESAVTWNAQGPAGPAGVSGYQRVTGQSDLNSDPEKSLYVGCPTGKKPIGGGAGVYGAPSQGGSLVPHGIGVVID